MANCKKSGMETDALYAQLQTSPCTEQKGSQKGLNLDNIHIGNAKDQG